MKYWLLTAACLFLLACEEGTQKSTPPHAPPVAVLDSQRADFQADTLAGEGQGRQAATPPPHVFPYRLDQPAGTFKLPGRLTEISGLSLSSDGRFLLANNDEDGKIFFLEKESGEVAEEIKFDSAGDYEGIEMVGEKIFVVKSNGTVYEVKHPGQKKQDTDTHKTDLNSDHNVEGLAFDAAANRLLLACKGKAGKGDRFKRKRAVYAFDLETEKLADEPVLLIDRDEIQRWADSGKGGLTEKLAEFFEPSLADDAFAPSGLAIHPLTKEIFIVSSVGKIVVVLNPSGNIVHLEPLDPELHRQPEGICFDRDGTLFVANEGKGGTAKIFRFSMN